ncbi:hypothetical protein CIG75_11065 [Tumebacillus algifaecis]|uniref:Uncharacterized protein n=2 Tax=Tumebacillus algifaecis TaxID=1214604 RepID=A0A223D6T1_9BACL|nr:hypothetical protein CIG75_11065 [Tumebacillus algifaecis]
MAGRFPGAKNTAEFWHNLTVGTESIRSLTEEELKAAGVDSALLSDPFYVKRGAVLEGAELFDADYFDFLPKEAEVTDPQQRLFLECAHEALEDAGYDPQQFAGAVGVFGGTGRNTYVNHIYANPELVQAVGKYGALIGNDADYLATRVAYKLNLRGPALTVQTACSTSMVAVHLACQSLLTYECDMALAGGVAVKDPQVEGYLYQDGGILSPDGHCRAFDAKAQGTVVGNGAGVVLLKRLDEAVADGDHIYAVIRGSAVNNDGSVKVGFTAPSVARQAAVISEALAMAEVEAETISYVEAHGTGTTLGDPIEIAALTQAFRESGVAGNGFCAVGSVKTNVGHLDAAAGVTGLIKTALALQHRVIPATLHVEEPNPQIDFANSPFYINGEQQAWQTKGVRRAGVSSFGIGGTNAHLILEEAPSLEQGSAAKGHQLLMVSAKTDSALEALSSRLADELERHPEIDLADVAYTLQVGRTLHGHRRAVVCQDVPAALRALRDPSLMQTRVVSESAEPFVVFLFSGQGAQYVNMGQELYASVPAFREEVDRLAALAASHLGCSLLEIWAREDLHQTQYAQVALFVFDYALAKLWQAWGVEPQAMIGHSIGEYVAAVLAGVMSLEEALELIVVRGRLMQDMQPGAMMALAMGEADVRKLLAERDGSAESAQREAAFDLVEDGVEVQSWQAHEAGVTAGAGTDSLSIACVNGVKATVVAGPFAAIEALEVRLAARGVTYRRLETSHAFHSEMMEPMLERFAAAVSRMKLSPPKKRYLSNLTGTWITAEEATDPSYYVRHLRETVRFGENVGAVLQEPNCVFLEVGPGRSLTTLVKEVHPVVLATTRHRDEGQSDVACLLNSVAQLVLHGVHVNWQAMHADERRLRLSLPTYPFERRKFYVETGAKKPFRQAGKLADRSEWFYLPLWKQSAPVLKTEHNSLWLVFLDEDGWGDKLVRQLRDAGEDVCTVAQGEEFAVLEGGHFTLNPTQRADYSQLLKQVMPSKIVQLWNLDAPSQDAGFYSMLFLTQALGEQQSGRDCQIFVVTNRLQDVTDDEVLHPERATMLGVVKVISQEYPNLMCRAVDAVLGKQEDRLIEQLLAEFTADDAKETFVAYRGKHRYVQTFEPIRIPDALQNLKLRQGGVYLLTGAGHALGKVFAEQLAQTVKAKLILVAAPGTPRAVVDTEHLFFHADVADVEQMESVVAQALTTFGEIHGVLHAEEVIGSGLIQLKTKELADRVLRPKVQGTLVLHQVLRNCKLDFFALFSRTISFTGGFGQVDNAAASAFLDAFARSQPDVVVVNWSGWQFDAWQAAQTMILPELQKHLQQLQLRFGLSAEEGLVAFERVLGSGLKQVIVSTQDFQTALEELSFFHTSAYLKSLPQTAPIAGGDLLRPYMAPRNEVEQTVVALWQELFTLDRVSVQDNFFELGGNSLLGVQLVMRLRQTFGLDVPMSMLYDSPTVAGLAQSIVKQQIEHTESDELEAMLLEIESLSIEEAQAILTGK